MRKSHYIETARASGKKSVWEVTRLNQKNFRKSYPNALKITRSWLAKGQSVRQWATLHQYPVYIY